jgi:hypothetical protein
MAFVLAIEPDPRQAAILRRVVREQVRADLVLVDSTEAGIDSLRQHVPDLILTTTLLSPRDEGLIVQCLRGLEHASHLQTLAIPLLSAAPKKRRKSRVTDILRRDLLKKRSEPAHDPGCDPAVFADEIRSYLARAADRKAELASRRKAPASAGRPATPERIDAVPGSAESPRADSEMLEAEPDSSPWVWRRRYADDAFVPFRRLDPDEAVVPSQQDPPDRVADEMPAPPATAAATGAASEPESVPEPVAEETGSAGESFDRLLTALEQLLARGDRDSVSGDTTPVAGDAEGTAALDVPDPALHSDTGVPIGGNFLAEAPISTPEASGLESALEDSPIHSIQPAAEAEPGTESGEVFELTAPPPSVEPIASEPADEVMLAASSDELTLDLPFAVDTVEPAPEVSGPEELLHEPARDVRGAAVRDDAAPATEPGDVYELTAPPLLTEPVPGELADEVILAAASDELTLDLPFGVDADEPAPEVGGPERLRHGPPTDADGAGLQSGLGAPGSRPAAVPDRTPERVQVRDRVDEHEAPAVKPPIDPRVTRAAGGGVESGPVGSTQRSAPADDGARAGRGRLRGVLRSLKGSFGYRTPEIEVLGLRDTRERSAVPTPAPKPAPQTVKARPASESSRIDPLPVAREESAEAPHPAPSATLPATATNRGGPSGTPVESDDLRADATLHHEAPTPAPSPAPATDRDDRADRGPRAARRVDQTAPTAPQTQAPNSSEADRRRWLIDAMRLAEELTVVPLEDEEHRPPVSAAGPESEPVEASNDLGWLREAIETLRADVIERQRLDSKPVEFQDRVPDPGPSARPAAAPPDLLASRDRASTPAPPVTQAGRPKSEPSRQPRSSATAPARGRTPARHRVARQAPRRPPPARSATLAAWARREAVAPPTAPARPEASRTARADCRALMASLGISPGIANVTYGQGCRIERVRVARAPHAKDPDRHVLILSRRLLGELHLATWHRPKIREADREDSLVSTP